MKKLLILVLFLIVLNSLLARDISEIISPVQVLSVCEHKRDTIDIYEKLVDNEKKILIFSAHWCDPSYRELNCLYNQGMIDSLINHGFSLIMIAEDYPCLFLNSGKIVGDWDEKVMMDFEVYYDMDGSALKKITGGSSFPYMLVFVDGKIVRTKEGCREEDNYASFLFDCLSQSSILNKRVMDCPICAGSGMVKPGRHSDPDGSVGICPACGGSKNRIIIH